MRRISYFIGLLAGTLFCLLLLRLADVAFNTSQTLSILIFSMFIYGTLLFGEFRLAFALGGIALLLGLNLLTVERFTEAANLKVIVFLINMFMVIGFLEENQFFEHVVAWIVRMVGPRPRLLLLVLMVMATVSAALVDEVTSILFMTGTVLHLTRRYRLNPVPFVIMLVFATNIGSSASSIGNPIGVMIALNAGFTFVQFLRWSAPIALAVNIVTYLICRWWFADAFSAFEGAVAEEHALARRTVVRRRVLAMAGGGDDSPPERDALEEDATSAREMPVASNEPPLDAEARRKLRISWAVFAATILLLVTHGLSERWLGLREGTMMVGASMTMGCVVLLLQNRKARELVERRVDWWTLCFFMMLFASVGTLEQTRVTAVIADKLVHATRGNQTALIQLVGWATGCLSAFLDNVLAVATFMPVVHDVRAAAAPAAFPASIYWAMLFGGTFMGNMTVIGSTANIIAVGLLEKHGHGAVRFWYWMKIGLIVSIASMLVASTLLWAQARWIPQMPAPPSVTMGR
jgi:Na+/H+ antiporter NhaD/arsenite permease-like protein